MADISQELNEVKAQYGEIKLQVGLLQRDVSTADRQCEKVSQRVAESLEKLKEMNVNLVKMISIHEEKHLQHERVEGELKEDIKELHSRITTVNREMHERMMQVESNISSKIDNLRSDLVSQEVAPPEDKKKVLNFILDFNRYKWMIIGAALVIGFIIGNIEIVAKIIKLFTV
jgi:chromosome segregation ATPase